MGILSDNENYYYYFKLRNGVEYDIKKSLIQINTDIMRNYRVFTSEQIEFYIDNPSATVQEVVKCKLAHQYEPPTTELSEYISIKTRELKSACVCSVSVSTMEYAMANACLAVTSLTFSGKKHYSVNDAKSIMKRFMDESDAAMSIYEAFCSNIKKADSAESVDAIYESAINELKKI